MTPLLTGVFASQISGHLEPPFTSTGSYDALATYIVPSGGVSSITFSGFPTDGRYNHLQIRAVLRGSAANTAAQTYIQINDITSDSYTWHGMYGDGSSVGTENHFYSSKSGMYSQFRYSASNSPSGVFGVGVCDILDAFSTTKYKTIRSISGYDSNGSGQVRFYSGATIANTDAINKIKLVDQESGYAQFSQITVYGVK